MKSNSLTSDVRDKAFNPNKQKPNNSNDWSIFLVDRFEKIRSLIKNIKVAQYNKKGVNIGYKEGVDVVLDFISSELQREREKCKCSDCSPEDEHVCPNDRSTTRISRPCGGCGKHQTIAGALIKSQEWQDWCKYAWENKLFDTDETDTVDAMSDEHFSSFMDFIRQREREKVLEEVRKIIRKRLDSNKIPVAALFFQDCPNCGQEVNRKWVNYTVRRISKRPLEKLLSKINKLK